MASLRLLVLKFVRDYIGRWGSSPSYGEISAGLNTSRTSIHWAVKSLVRDRLLLRAPGPRGLALPETREAALRVLVALGWQVIPGNGRLVPPDSVTNPILPGMPVLDYTAPQGDGGERHGGEIPGGEEQQNSADRA